MLGRPEHIAEETIAQCSPGCYRQVRPVPLSALLDLTETVQALTKQVASLHDRLEEVSPSPRIGTRTRKRWRRGRKLQR